MATRAYLQFHSSLYYLFRYRFLGILNAAFSCNEDAVFSTLIYLFILLVIYFLFMLEENTANNKHARPLYNWSSSNSSPFMTGSTHMIVSQKYLFGRR